MKHETIQLSLAYNGIAEDVSLYHYPGVATLMSGKDLCATKAEIRGITCVSAKPGSSEVQFQRKGKVVKVYDSNTDPMRFIFDPALHNTALLKDQLVDGAQVSHHTYFNAQLKHYRKSVMWGLCNILKLKRHEARRFVNIGVAQFKENIKAKYGVDLDSELDAESAANDAAIMAKEASRFFYEGQG